MSAWVLILLVGVTTIWVAIASALLYLVAADRAAAEPVRARGLEPPRALRPSGT